MRQPLFIGLSAGVAGLVLAGLTPLFPAPAVSAQDLIFDWGGEKTADSGKSHIKFAGTAKTGDIIVSFGDRKLYLFTAPGEADTYPIAIPRDQSRWEGVTTVSQKRENPSWTPTPHMLAENPKLPRWVPGGHPMNPLGIRALYLGSSDYRIHGTDAPWTIGTAASKGCVRMFNKDVVDIYARVRVGAKVTVTWQKFDGKTLVMAEHAKAVSDPDPDHGQGGKVVSASYNNDDDANATPRPAKSKHRKADPADEASTEPHQDKPAAPAVPPSEVATSTTDEASAAHKPVGDAASTHETAPKPANDDVATEPRPHRNRRTPSRAAASVETGSIASGEKNEAATLSVVERALAAAERAEHAAERAAAAAERATAATQSAVAPAGSPSSGNEITAH